jgi:transposase-like protein
MSTKDQKTRPPVQSAPDPEVLARPSRRLFTAQYKLKIVQEADACAQPGDVAALLRREGLYSSHLTDWRRLRDKGALQALAHNKRGPKTPVGDPWRLRAEQLEKENQGLLARLRQAEAIIDVQKKLSALLEPATIARAS